MGILSAINLSLLIDSRTKLLLFCGSLVLFAYGITSHNVATATQGDVQRPASITDFDAITKELETTLYVVDSERRTLYRHKMSTTSPEALTLNDFEPFPLAQNFQKPTTITHKGNSLYVCDQLAQSIYEIDTQNSTINRIIEQIAISKPLSIAVSQSGTIAVGDDDNDSVVAFEPIKDEKGVTTGYNRKSSGRLYDDPDRIIFIGNDLLVLETESGKLSLVGGSGTAEQNQSESPVTTLLARIKTEFREIQDLAYLNGVFYVVSHGRVLAFTPVSSHKSFPLFKEGNKLSRNGLPRIVASRDSLFLKDSHSQSISTIPRPVPVNVNFEPNAITQALTKTHEQQRSALLFLYEYLGKNDALATKEITTQRQYTNLKELLFEQHVLIDSNYADDASEGKLNSDKRLTELICKYNAGFCMQPHPLTRSIPANQSFILPHVPRESDLTSIDLSLGRMSVRAALSQILIPEHMQEVTSEYLLLINRANFETFESELARESFIPAGWTGISLRPGTVLGFENGREKVLGDLGDCLSNFNDRIEMKKVEIRNSLRTTAVESVLPRRSMQTADSKTSDLNIHEAVIDGEAWTEESINFDVLNDLIRSAQSDPRCASLVPVTAPTEQTYVVQKAIKTTGAKYRLFKKDGSPKSLTTKELDLANLLGELGEDYSLIVSTPVYYGYSLLRVDGSKPVHQWLPAVVTDVKPGGKQDIFSVTGRVLRLPATRWRLSLFVNALDVYDDTSNLNRTLAIPGVSLLKEERNDSTPAAEMSLVVAFPGGAQDPLVSEQERIIKENRELLLRRSGPLPAVPRLIDIYVAVAEEANSVQLDHPDFAGVWYAISGSPIPVPVAVPASSVLISGPIIKDFAQELDHGNHVAGLIGARGARAPGLASGVRLLLLDTSKTSEASLEKLIDNAFTRGVRIFNFSFTINSVGVNASLDQLKTQMRTKWRSALFVAAAGNRLRDQTGDLASLGDRVPVTWVRDVHNIVGVAAADTNFNVLGDWECKPGKLCPGSNYSHTYIQLVAPGLKLYSTASGGKYSSATGSSQAVPQVTATAAMLLAQKPSLAPSLIKGRMIYTADWFTQYDDPVGINRKVWGGLLNIKRAVLHPDKNLVIFSDFSSIINSLTFLNTHLRIKKDASTCEIDDPNNNLKTCPDSISFEKTLRIWKQPNGLYRVTFLDDDDKLRIMKDASLEGKIRCQGLFEMDPITNQFSAANKCTTEKDVTEIIDYVAEIPGKEIGF